MRFSKEDYEDAEQEAWVRMLCFQQKGGQVSNQRKFLNTCKANYLRDLAKCNHSINNESVLAAKIDRPRLAVFEALSLMDGRFPELLYLRYIKGIPHREIAKLLNRPVTCVSTDLTRAKIKFAEAYAQVA